MRAGAAEVTVHDRLHGRHTGIVDDFIVRRGDGVPAYNLAVVLDDEVQGVVEVVRADDLLEGTPRQAWLCGVLGIAVPDYAHVPLVVGPDGERLAKRHGSVTRADLRADGWTDARLLAVMGASLGLCRPDESVDAALLLDRFDPDAVPTDPWAYTPV